MKPWQQGLALMWHFMGRGRSRPASILLAVAWGTMSMMLLLAFGEGLKIQITRGRAGLGAGLVVLFGRATTYPFEGMKAGRAIQLTEGDVAALGSGVPGIDNIAGERERWGVELRWRAKSVAAHLTGVMPCFETIRAHYPSPGGRFINDMDQASDRRVLFLGRNLKERLFGKDEAVGQTVLVGEVPFTVIGVMIDKRQDRMYGGPDTDRASIPLSAFEALFGKTSYDDVLYAVRPGLRSKEVELGVRKILARRHKFDPEDQAALWFWDTAVDEVETRKILNGLEAFLGLVGGMTLLVAGVGLANMLFVTVQRRTREIGLQMAIGAKRGAVIAQIVGESLVIAGIGGYLGIGLSWLLVEVIQRIPIKSEGLQFLGKPTLSVPLGIVTCVALIGVACLAGAFPARRAARLNPVEALRHD